MLVFTNLLFLCDWEPVSFSSDISSITGGLVSFVMSRGLLSEVNFSLLLVVLCREDGICDAELDRNRLDFLLELYVFNDCVNG